MDGDLAKGTRVDVRESDRALADGNAWAVSWLESLEEVLWASTGAQR